MVVAVTTYTGSGQRGLILPAIADDYPADVTTTGHFVFPAELSPLGSDLAKDFKGRIDSANDSDWIRIEMNAGYRYHLLIFEHRTRFSFNIQLEIRDGNGRLVVPRDRTSGFFFTPTEDATYYVAAVYTGAPEWYADTAYSIRIIRDYPVPLPPVSPPPPTSPPPSPPPPPPSPPPPPPPPGAAWTIDQQWHLSDHGSGAGGLPTHINARAVWPDTTGRGVVIGFIDEGIDYAHRNLAPNYDVLIDFDAVDHDGDARPSGLFENHGTATSGVAAASPASIAGGGSGVAPNATLVGYRAVFGYGAGTYLLENLRAQTAVDVSSNSWGFVGLFDDNFLEADRKPFADALEHGVSIGRGGLGTVFVFAAGNARGDGDNVNMHNMQNSRFVIAVAATTQSGAVAPFSTPGAAILVGAPGQNILTTDRTGSGYGYDIFSDYATVNGTSFSAPMVSGVVALMLEANPNLGYRDVQTILAMSARHQPLRLESWAINGAQTWNGGGMVFGHDVGFGLVDAHAAVRLAESWDQGSTFANAAVSSAERNGKIPIPDNTPAGMTSTLNLDDSVLIERVEVRLVVDHARIGNLVVTLISPSGTESILLDRPGLSGDNGGSYLNGIDFVFDSVHFWGERSGGQWTLKIVDAAAGATGQLISWQIAAYGRDASHDSTYIFTEEYSAFAATDPSRRTLHDGRGIDTINLAAVTTASAINLMPGARSTVGGQILSIAADTTIEHAVGGDGDDAISGNAADNSLRGGRGNDVLDGGAGNDRLDGGPGADQMTGGSGDDIFVVDDPGDAVVEIAGNGTDLVLVARETYTLGANLENAAVSLAHGVWLTGNAADNVLLGGDGDDVLKGLNGDDTIGGGGGRDTIDAGAGNDVVYGGGGDDLITLGPGKDRLVVFLNLDGSQDRVTDFAPGLDGDILDFREIFDAVGYGEDTPESDGFLRFRQNGTDTLVEIDSNGGGDSYATVAVLQNTPAAAIIDANHLFQ